MDGLLVAYLDLARDLRVSARPFRPFFLHAREQPKHETTRLNRGLLLEGHEEGAGDEARSSKDCFEEETDAGLATGSVTEKIVEKGGDL